MNMFLKTQSRLQRKPSLGLARIRLAASASNPEHLDASPGATLITGASGDFSRMPTYAKASTRLQIRPAVNAPGDMYEQEADRVADRVMNMQELPQHDRARGGDGFKWRNQADRASQENKAFRTHRPHESETGASVTPRIFDQVSGSTGHPPDTGARAFMEPRFGGDFSRVRVHSDASANILARHLQARAFTTGSDIFFAANEYQPHTATGRRLFAHELAHVVQQREQIAPTGAVQCAPAEPTEVSLRELSTAEADLAMYTYGIKLPGGPPRVKFGEDGPVQEADRKMVQLAFNLAYRAASSPSFASRFGEFKGVMEKNLPEISGLNQQKYLEAMNRMVVHLADTSKDTLISKSVQAESNTAGFTLIGGNDVYIRSFAIQEGRDALASLLLHESFHVAGVPAKPIDEFLEWIMEGGVHEVESAVGLPLSQIALGIASIESVEAQGQGAAFTVRVTAPDQVDADTVRIEVLDGNRNLVFLQERPTARFTERFTWNGLSASGEPTESGIHSLRVIAGGALYAAHDYVLRRAKG